MGVVVREKLSMGRDKGNKVEDYLISEFETRIFWIETGFIPPVYYQKVIETLHQVSQRTDISVSCSQDPVIEAVMAFNPSSGCFGYYFFDADTFLCFAQSVDVLIDNRAYEEIAEEIIEKLVEEYGIDFKALKTSVCPSGIGGEKSAFNLKISN